MPVDLERLNNFKIIFCKQLKSKVVRKKASSKKPRKESLSRNFTLSLKKKTKKTWYLYDDMPISDITT